MMRTDDNLFTNFLLVAAVGLIIAGVIWGFKTVNRSATMLQADEVYKVVHYSGGKQIGTYGGHVETCGIGCISVRRSGSEVIRYLWGDFTVEPL